MSQYMLHLYCTEQVSHASVRATRSPGHSARQAQTRGRATRERERERERGRENVFKLKHASVATTPPGHAHSASTACVAAATPTHSNTESMRAPTLKPASRTGSLMSTAQPLTSPVRPSNIVCSIAAVVRYTRAARAHTHALRARARDKRKARKCDRSKDAHVPGRPRTLLGRLPAPRERDGERDQTHRHRHRHRHTHTHTHSERERERERERGAGGRGKEQVPRASRFGTRPPGRESSCRDSPPVYPPKSVSVSNDH